MGSIDHKLDVTGMGQKTPATCWLACYKMLMKKAGQENSDTSIKSRLKVFNISFDEAYDDGLHSSQWSLAAFALGFAPMIPLQYKLNTNMWGKTSGQEAFLALLAKGPLWIGRNVNSATSHAIIARGYDSWENEIIWLNPESASGNAFDNRSKLDLFIGKIGSAMGGVQLHTAHARAS